MERSVGFFDRLSWNCLAAPVRSPEAGLPTVISHHDRSFSADACTEVDIWSIHEAQRPSMTSGPGVFSASCMPALPVSPPAMIVLRSAPALLPAGLLIREGVWQRSQLRLSAAL